MSDMFESSWPDELLMAAAEPLMLSPRGDDDLDDEPLDDDLEGDDDLDDEFDDIDDSGRRGR
jgi:hypothetical protein